MDSWMHGWIDGLRAGEVEEGDLDDIDEDAVRNEVGRLHHRAVLDEDKREVRLFQEAFLEDGELHSDNARQRKFRWKNVGESRSYFLFSRCLAKLVMQIKVFQPI